MNSHTTPPFPNLSSLPAFTRALLSSTAKAELSFATPGHHGGAFFRTVPEGALFADALSRMLFSADVSDSDFDIGDPSSHRGLTGEAESLAARVFHSDKTWFLCGGTSASNRIATEALLSSDDYVLFDRSNHKSVYQGALLRTGATPIYISSLRNEIGCIGGIDFSELNESYLRKRLASLSPNQSKKDRPFRLACLQLVTYDGVFLNTREILRRIGHLCEYILFDSAWAGYESFLPILSDYSPLTITLTEEDPGLLVTQSVHKQLCGFSQTSQLHKKDNHIRHKPYYVPDELIQHACDMNSSTSPYFPFIAAMEMNAHIHGQKGSLLWQDAMMLAIHIRKSILASCRYIRPFIPPVAKNQSWSSESTETIAASVDFFRLSPQKQWHGFPIPPGADYCIDPCKILLATDSAHIPATLLSLYLQERGIIPEKSDGYTLLLLSAPGDSSQKSRALVSALQSFEKDFERNASLSQVLPHYAKNISIGLRQFSENFHAFWKNRRLSSTSRRLFSASYFPPSAVNPQTADRAFISRRTDYIPLSSCIHRIAAEYALAYPPGICAVVPGERWNETAVNHFLSLAEMHRRFPILTPTLTGLHQETEQGRPVFYAHVLQESTYV